MFIKRAIVLALTTATGPFRSLVSAKEISHKRFSGEATNFFNGLGQTDFPNRILANVMMRSEGGDGTEGKARGPIASGAAEDDVNNPDDLTSDIEDYLHVQARCWAKVNNHLFIGGHAVQIPKALAFDGRSPGNRRRLDSNCDQAYINRNPPNLFDENANTAQCLSFVVACCEGLSTEECQAFYGVFGPGTVYSEGARNCQFPPCAESCDTPPCNGNRALFEENEDDCLITGSCRPGTQFVYIFSNIGTDEESANDLMLQDFDVKECTGFGELAASLELTNMDPLITGSFTHESFEAEL